MNWTVKITLLTSLFMCAQILNAMNEQFMCKVPKSVPLQTNSSRTWTPEELKDFAAQQESKRQHAQENERKPLQTMHAKRIDAFKKFVAARSDDTNIAELCKTTVLLRNLPSELQSNIAEYTDMQCLKTLNIKNVQCMTMHVDQQGSSYLVAGAWDGKVRIWKAPNWEQTGETNARTHLLDQFGFKRRAIPIGCIATHPDKNGSWNLITGSEDGTVQIFQGPSGTPVATLIENSGERIRNLATHKQPDGSCCILAASRDGTLRIWDEATKKIMHEFGNAKDLRCMASYTDANGNWHIITGMDDGRVQVWDGSRGKLVATLDEHTTAGNPYSRSIKTITTHTEPNGTWYILSAAGNGACRWQATDDWNNWESDGFVAEGKINDITTFTARPDGFFITFPAYNASAATSVTTHKQDGKRYIITGMSNGNLSIVQYVNGAWKPIQTLTGHKWQIEALTTCALADGSWYIISGSCDSVNIWCNTAQMMINDQIPATSSEKGSCTIQ